MSHKKFDFNKRLLIIGCGGHSKVIADIADSLGFLNIQYLSELKGKDREQDSEKEFVSSINENYQDYFSIAIGDNFSREKVYRDFKAKHPKALGISLIHPSSQVSKKLSLGECTVVMPLCVINSSSTIGKGVIINTSSVVEHECVLGDFASIATGVKLGGEVKIGVRSSIGIGSSIKHKVTIGNDVVVGGGSLVLKDIKDNYINYGVPSKSIRKRKIDEKYL